MAHPSYPNKRTYTAHDPDAHQASGSSAKQVDAKERKRTQNRLAQRTYKIAAGHHAANTGPQTSLTPPSSENCQTWLSEIDHVLDPNLDFPAFDIPSAPEATMVEENGDVCLWFSLEESVVAIETIFVATPLDTCYIITSPIAKLGGSCDPFDSLVTGVKPGLNRTALHRAVLARQEVIAKLLLEHGADATKLDGNGQTALHLAVQHDNRELVKIMLESRVDPNMQDSLGQTALFQAVQNSNEAIARLLLESSIDVNFRDTFGNVALHLAVEKGIELMIEILLSYGADIDA
ncbi:MAG: hypothetical protein Q9174_002223 [Haloplaca sp. 1 TL-2023]